MTRGRKPLGGAALTVAERSRRYRDSKRAAGAAEVDALHERIVVLEAEVAALRAAAPGATTAPSSGLVLVASDRASRIVSAIAKEQFRWSRRAWPKKLAENDVIAWDQLPSLVLWLWGRTPQNARSLAHQEFSDACSWVETGTGGVVTLTAAKNPFLIDDPSVEAGLPELPDTELPMRTPREFATALPPARRCMGLTMDFVQKIVKRRRALRKEAEQTVNELQRQHEQREKGG